MTNSTQEQPTPAFAVVVVMQAPDSATAWEEVARLTGRPSEAQTGARYVGDPCPVAVADEYATTAISLTADNAPVTVHPERDAEPTPSRPGLKPTCPGCGGSEIERVDEEQSTVRYVATFRRGEDGTIEDEPGGRVEFGEELIDTSDHWLRCAGCGMQAATSDAFFSEGDAR